MEYATYRVLYKGPKSVEMEYSILTLTAREIFLKIPKSFTEKLVHTPWIGDIIGGIFQFMGYDNTDDNI